MNSFQKLLMCLVIGFVFFDYGCKNDDDPSDCNYLTETQDELATFNAAATAYANSQTTANCQAYKVAAQAYLDELEDHLDCATLAGQGAEIQSSITSAQASVDAIQC